MKQLCDLRGWLEVIATIMGVYLYGSFLYLMMTLRDAMEGRL